MVGQKTVVVSGSSGLIGTALVDRLRQTGHEVRRLVRSRPRYADEYRWDPYDATVDLAALDAVDAVINLSGANIGARRWTESRKEVLYSSRIVTTDFLAETIAALKNPPRVFVSQSAIGVYGDRGDELLNDYSRTGPRDDFLADLTMDWEKAARPARKAGIRVVHPRTGLVISPEAALIERLLPFFKTGLGGPLGNGKQWWSWISMRDTVDGIIQMVDSELEGPVNLVAPNPVRQKEFAEELARALGRPAAIPVPGFGLKLVLGGEKAEAIGLSSTRVSPERLLASGYEFADTHIEQALERMFGEEEGDRSLSSDVSR